MEREKDSKRTREAVKKVENASAYHQREEEQLSLGSQNSKRAIEHPKYRVALHGRYSDSKQPGQEIDC
jgi:hypothetical protein